MGNLSSGMANSSYYDLARNQLAFTAYANVTAPVIYTTAAGTGGPLLWNGSAQAGPNQVRAIILGVTCSNTVASTVAGTIGITGNSGQTTAPTSTTAITASGNGYVGGNPPKCSVYSVGTPTNAGNFFLPLVQIGTGAITVDNMDTAFTDLGGCIVVPPNAWIAVSSSATLTTGVFGIGLIWAEVPIL